LNRDIVSQKDTLMRRQTSFAGLLLVLLLLLLAPGMHAAAHRPCCGEITSAGVQLASVLDGMNVEALWIANQHVNWETGEPDRGAAYEGPGKHTHCSAFAAAAAKQLGVYLLRPPEHGQLLLANAQAQWLSSAKAMSEGWRPVMGAEMAQTEANRGNLVVVVFANPDQREPGHVAIIRPSEKSLMALERNGPDIIQAGTHNHVRTVVRIGFENHPGAWPDGVRYYMHLLNLR
jgi:hypothetical protein